MKKLLLIFTLILSSVSFSETVTLDTTQYRNFTTFFSAFESALDLIVSNDQSLNDDLHTYLFSDDYKQLISDLASFLDFESEYTVNLGEFFRLTQGLYSSNYDILTELDYIFQTEDSILYNIYEMQNSDNEFYNYLYQYSLGSNVEASKAALESIDSDMDNLKISVTQLGDKIDQIVVNGNNTSDDLQTIIAELQKLNGDSSGGSSQLPVTTVGFYDLEEYGKDVNTENLSFSSLTTTGEFNKDVYNLLINLNQLGSSQNNSLLSMLTNVQVIASSVGGNAEGEDKVEKDIEERGYKADQANQELNSIVSQSFESYFAPPRVSEVFNGVTVSLSDTQLPSRITIIDAFHYESGSFSAELDDIGFDVPNGLLDLAHYGRIVFGFLYWTAAVYIALFVFRLWIKLYTYVSGLLN